MYWIHLLSHIFVSNGGHLTSQSEGSLETYSPSALLFFLRGTIPLTSTCRAGKYDLQCVAVVSQHPIYVRAIGNAQIAS